jgi:glutamate-ammonia-ligase adenylyltransferase
MPFQVPDYFEESILTVFTSSEYVFQHCEQNPNLLIALLTRGDLFVAYHEQTYHEKLAQLSFDNEAALMKTLRLFRHQEMVRIAWRDIANWENLSQILRELSWLAEACIQTALNYLYLKACEKRGTPLLNDGRPQQLIVLGMGKLGAFELNYSSDIDLIFAYPQEGTLSDRKQTTYSEFFTRLCQSLVHVLDEITVDGFVFRTDTRLRPYGDSGALIMTFDGMEHYYQTQAREWERYAMIKARQVAGDFDQGALLMKMLNAFVYRRYLDYGAFEELRLIKSQIVQELHRKDRIDNIKLGRGGIREIEFIGQAFQLIRGGSEKRLQTRGILDVLSVLSECGILPTKDVQELQTAYVFLRRVENRLQQYQDKQTHDLPINTHQLHILACALGYASWHFFLDDLNTIRDSVHAIFDEVFSLSKQETSQTFSQKIWQSTTENKAFFAHLADYGFREPQQSWLRLVEFKQESSIRRLSNKGLGVVNRLMPQVIDALGSVTNPDETLKRLLMLFAAVAGRNVYLALLAENPGALRQLITLCSASPWIGNYLAHYPILFDELLDTRSLYEPLQMSDLSAQLSKRVANLDHEDLEALMITLREFKQVNMLRIAAADIMGVIALMVVSDYLTFLAQSILGCVLSCAWQMLVLKHGYPPQCDDKSIKFAIIGFGKLGGLELGYGSDLDMVFIYDCEDGNALTNGDKPISTRQFYTRLGQKIRHILDTKLLSGELYDVDMRLRPNGDSGALVTHINSYEPYLIENAWTWELQALVRSRFITGDVALGTCFSQMRQRVLSLPRDIKQLKKEVKDMREKMRESLSNKDASLFDLKQDEGGMVDIEFMVQFSILANAVTLPEALTAYSDNVRLLQALAQHGIIYAQTATLLTEAYCAYRNAGHKRVLQGIKTLTNNDEFLEQRNFVKECWHKMMN